MKKNPFPINKYLNLSFGDEFLESLEGALFMVFQRKTHADKAIGKVFAVHKNWGEGLKGWFADITYDIIRWRALLVAHSGRPINRKIIEAFFELNGMRIKSEPLESVEKETPELKSAELKRSDYLSIPEWLDELGYLELGEDWAKEIDAMNTQAAMALRCNTLKTDIKTLKKRLLEEGITTTLIDGYKTALLVDQKQNIFKTKSFQQGLFEVQDPSSQKVAEYLDPKPGMRVIDACAGMGGKSLHLACLMKNKGKVLSMDNAEWKLAGIKKRAKRAGSNIIETRFIQGTKTIKRLNKSADRLLLDVPCSGLGVLRRNPDIKWSLQPEDLDEIKKNQAYILNFYSQMLKPGGIMTYASCSILPSENENQVNAFLESDRGREFKLIECVNFRPSKTGFDGFFIACFKKKNII
ncbi:MAG: RsmB/NOP family class I SAM-dependent RNA methyltransferase [Saprospirales bacterium]|nr:MAG: RsmB/NOP family class I SAM-dependent RNA methyltransferase [Saprospirales bacterium]